MPFIKGMTLCEDFFHDVAKPVLDTYFPDLLYTAGLLGYGSDVLGYDNEISTDHMWGPRFYLFLMEQDIDKKDAIMQAFSSHFPYSYKGYSIHFSAPDPNDNGIRHAELISEGTVSPLIFIHTVDEFLQDYLGETVPPACTPIDWLSFSEHRLLALTAGKLFVDELDMSKMLLPLRFYPQEVKLYLLASNWSLIAEEQAFTKRCSECGDEMGSRLVCARIVERLMRLLFLYCDRYAPYSKWFGTAFSRLPVDDSIKTSLSAALCASDIVDRENNLVEAQRLVANLHNECGLSDFVPIAVQRYFNRSMKVIHPDRIAVSLSKRLVGTPLENLPLIGTLSEVANFTTLYESPTNQTKIKQLYQK